MLSTIAVRIFAVFFINSAYVYVAKSAPSDADVCKTESCLETSNILKSSMDTSVDPCDNFYKYACGNYPKWKADKYPVNGTWSWVEEIDDNMQKRIKNFLNAKLNDSEPDSVKKVPLVYQSCIDTDAMHQRGLETLRQLLRDIGVSSTAPLQNDAKNFSWIHSAAKLKRLTNKDFLFTLTVFPDPLFETKQRLYLVPQIDGGILMPQETPKRKSVMNLGSSSNSNTSTEAEGFSKYARNLVELFTDSKNLTELENKIIDLNIADVAQFNVKRNAIIPDKEKTVFDIVLGNTEQMTVRELQNITNSIITKGDGNVLFNWEEYFKVLLEGIDGVNIDLNTTKFHIVKFKKLKKIIKLVAEKSSDVLENAIWFDVVSNFNRFTTNELRSLQFPDESGSFNKTIWESSCLSIVKDLVGLAIVHKFVNEEAVVKDKVRVIAMLKHLKISLGVIIENADWIDNATETSALEKIKKMKNLISHPHWLRNETALNEYYKDVKVYEHNNFLLTFLKAQESDFIKSLKMYLNPLTADDTNNTLAETAVDPFLVNALYSPALNTMVVPMGILAKPFYGHDILALNFGGMGSVIGHELTHGFDTTGSQYDADGEEEDWWQEDTLLNYKNRTQCFVNAYNNITVGSKNQINCNGRRSLDENIADNGGFRESLMAYRNYVKENGQEKLLYGFEDISHDKLFTLAYANAWCEASTDSSLLSDTWNSHGPSEARVRGVLMNSEEFAEIWKCPKGSNMNPEKKCRVW